MRLYLLDFFTSAAARAGAFSRRLPGPPSDEVKKDKDKNHAASLTADVTTHPNSDSSSSHISRPFTQSTNIFSLVERFTFRPSPSETHLPSPPPLLLPEIQYWPGMIMRNVCHKDEGCGGIRKCVNMLCGKWETAPRDFAKCTGGGGR